MSLSPNLKDRDVIKLNKKIIKMVGDAGALQELILKIDPKVKVPFENSRRKIKVKVICALNDLQELRIIEFEFPTSGTLDQENDFDLTEV